MKKDQVILAVCLIFFAVLGVVFANYKKSVKINEEANKAVAAIQTHYLWYKSAMRYKERTGNTIDSEIYKEWTSAKGKKQISEDNNYPQNSFARIYGQLDYQIPGELTLAFGFYDGRWIYFMHQDKIQAGYSAQGLVDQASDNIDYMEEVPTDLSELGFLLFYKTPEAGKPQVIETNCIPLTKYKLEVCKKTFDILRKFNNEKIDYRVPDKITINDIEFERQ
ncbi:hypothetical protein AAIR98_000374 [Elusimicrobium simillimum]|uniref:hypothetical protein n=1 Tax=Elusimicrobium simillimum TaxID=3143438 RepID=UPI003C6F40A0